MNRIFHQKEIIKLACFQGRNAINIISQNLKRASTNAKVWIKDIADIVITSQFSERH